MYIQGNLNFSPSTENESYVVKGILCSNLYSWDDNWSYLSPLNSYAVQQLMLTEVRECNISLWLLSDNVTQCCSPTPLNVFTSSKADSWTTCRPHPCRNRLLTVSGRGDSNQQAGFQKRKACVRHAWCFSQILPSR